MCTICGRAISFSGFGAMCDDCWWKAESATRQSPGRAMVLDAGVEVRPINTTGGVIMTCPQPATVRFHRHSVEFPLIFVLRLGVGALYRLIKHITKNTAISWYEGHVAICSWLRDTGEPSRADGLRVLGAVSYLGFWLVTCVVWAISLVSAVLT